MLFRSATQTTSQTIPTTTGDISGLSVTWTAIAGRRYRTTLVIPVADCASATTLAGLLDEGGTTVGQANQTITAGASSNLIVAAYRTGLSGSVTHKGRFVSTVAAGTATASSNVPLVLLVEDIGPSANP